MEESDLDSCQVALQENGACGQNGTHMYKCLPPNSIYCNITIHTHNTSTYHDSTRYTEWVTLWSGESSRGWWSWKWSYTVTHTSMCTWSCSQDSSWGGRERREYCITGKFGGEFNLANWQICERTAKLSTNIQWCHLVGWIWKLLTTSVRDKCEASFEDGIVQVLYQRAPDIPYESPLSFRQTSRKNECRSEACARRGYLWARQVQWIYARRKSTDWKEHGPAKAVRQFSKLLSRKVQLSIHSSASIFPLWHLNQMFQLGGAFGLRIRRVTIMYDIIARKNKTAKLKSAKWNWRPICQIKFPSNFPAIRYFHSAQHEN